VGVFTWLVGVLRGPASLVLPFLSRARRSTLLLRILLWTIHVVIVAAILVGLWFLSKALKIDFNIPSSSWVLREFWLPILFLLVYILCWLGWWVWKLLVTDDSYTEFPDITEAWEEACQALNRARVDLRELPLFLVVGRTEASMDALFKASKLALDVKQSPGRDDAPLHVFATRDAVYVTCEGASLLGRHAAGLAGDGGENDASPIDDDDPLNKTNQPGKAPGAVPEIAAIMARARGQRRELSAEEKRKIRVLMRQDRVRQPVVRNAGEVELLGARFEHLCQLLVRDRWPYCPINGMLLLLPFAATDTDQDALDAGAACQRDLSVARRVLQVNCPTLAMACDLETAPGFSAFLEQFPEKQRQQRIGQRSPMAPALETRGVRSGDAEARAAMLESLAQWICGSVAPGWVYKHFLMEPADQTAGVAAGPALSRTDQMEASRGGKAPRRTGGRAEVFRTNSDLFLFMHNLHERQRRLGRLLSRGVIVEDEDPILFGGCYLAATGTDAHREQAFVAGVFHRLVGEENYVSWTTQARAEEDSYQRWAFLGQMFTAVLFLGIASLWVYLLWQFGFFGKH
jgi:hypothetical protein